MWSMQDIVNSKYLILRLEWTLFKYFLYHRLMLTRDRAGIQ